jgi:hypothetical protein
MAFSYSLDTALVTTGDRGRRLHHYSAETPPPRVLGFGGLTTSLDGGFDGTEAGVEPGHVRLVLNSPGARVL